MTKREITKLFKTHNEISSISIHVKKFPRYAKETVDNCGKVDFPSQKNDIANYHMAFFHKI